MIEGQISYEPADLARLSRAFGRRPPLPFWAGAAMTAGLGAIIGHGGAIVLGRLLGFDWTVGSAPTAWGTAIGTFALVVVGAAWAGRKATTLPAVSQRLEVDDTSIGLSTETVRTHFAWSHFVRSEIGTDHAVLEGRDGNFVLLLPRHFRSMADWAALRSLLEAKAGRPAG